jgi:hypothetical protein
VYNTCDEAPYRYFYSETIYSTLNTGGLHMDEHVLATVEAVEELLQEHGLTIEELFPEMYLTIH